MDNKFDGDIIEKERSRKRKIRVTKPDTHYLIIGNFRIDEMNKRFGRGK